MRAGPLLPPGLPGAIVRGRIEVARGADGAATRVAVASIGAPERPAWILAHGVGSSAWELACTFASPVLSAGRRVVLVEARGHGASSVARDPADHHLTVLADDLRRVVAAMPGPIEVLGGISVGAHAAVRAASLLPVPPAHVVACLPAWTGAGAIGVGPHAAIAARIVEVGVEGALATLRATPGLASWLRTSVLRDQARHDRGSLSAALRALDGGLAPDLDELGELAAAGTSVTTIGWPDDPGHPLEVARVWAQAARGRCLVTDLHAPDRRRDEVGHLAVTAVTGSRPTG